MTINPYIVQRRAESVEDLQSTFALIDSRRMQYLAEILRQCDRPGAAELADSWAQEYALLARRYAMSEAA